MRPLPITFIASLALAVTLATGTTTAHAQDVRVSPTPVPPPTQARSPVPLPRPTVLVPVPISTPPPTKFPLPQLMTPPAGGLTHQFQGFTTNPARPGRDLFRSRAGATGVQQYLPYLGGGYPMAEGAPANYPPPAPSETGLLRLAVTPTTAQVFVDSFYVGTVDDVLAERALTLDAGGHRLEFRAPDYQPLVVGVRVPPNGTVTYNGSLDPVRAVAPPRPAAVSTAPMYIIPNCYIGNVPPQQSRLPAGCDAKQVQVREQK